MPLWIAVSVTAALFQCWRTALQQKLRGQMSVNAAGFVRYLYGAPISLMLFVIVLRATGEPVPEANPTFLVYCALGGLGQILATNLLIMSFGYRNFAVGTAYSKTETVQTAILAFIVLNETLSPFAWFGIVIGLSGVLTLSLAGRGLNAGELARATVQPAALCGLGSGLVFSFAIVFIKLANHSLASDSLVLRGLYGLAISNAMQVVMQGGYLLWREPQELKKAFTTWRTAMWVGTLSGLGSACWFTGFAIADVAMVRAVGQVEMVFTLLFSRFYLKETLKPGDVAGLILVVVGVLLIILLH